MDNKKTADFVNDMWDKSIIPEISEYIKVPNKSPIFDPDWEKNGHMEKAVLMLEAWSKQQPIKGMQVEIVRIEGRTPVPEREQLSKIAAIGATTCLYLSVGMMEKVVDQLLAGGAFTPETPVAVVSRASWADEKIIEGNLADITEKISAAGLTRQALIIVGEALAARHLGIKEKSKLYDAKFAHGFRSGK